MKARLLVFDPDPEGRRLFRKALRESCEGCVAVIRASADSCVQALYERSFDTLILGLPIDIPALLQVLLVYQEIPKRPELFLLAEQPPEGDKPSTRYFKKTKSGIIRFLEDLPGYLRPGLISRLADELERVRFDQYKGNARRTIAEHAIKLLSGLGLNSMYISIDPVDRHWVLHGSSYSIDIRQEIDALVEKSGMLAPDPARVVQPLGDVLLGLSSHYSDHPGEILRSIFHWATASEIEDLVKRLRLNALFMLPILDGESPCGILMVAETLSPQDQNALQTFANRLSTLLMRVESLDRLQRDAHVMRALQQVVYALSSTLDFETIQDQVLDLLKTVVPFDSACVILKEEGDLIVRQVRGFLPSNGAIHVGEVVVPPDRSALGQVVYDARPILLRVVEDPLRIGFERLPVDIKSWLGVPILWRSEIIGGMILGSREQGFFQEYHLQIALGFSRQLGVALQNARLLRSSTARAEKMQLVHEIGRSAVSILDIQQLALEVAAGALRVFNYYAVGILLNEDGRLVPCAYLRGPEGVPVSRVEPLDINAAGLAQEVVKKDQPLLISDVGKEPRFQRHTELPNTGCEMILPLSIAGEVLGVMIVDKEGVGQLGEEDLEMLQVLTSLIAISLINARLFGEIHDHAAALEERVESRTAELQSQKEQTEAILSSVADAVLVFDLEGDLVMANPQAQLLMAGEWSEGVLTQISRLHGAKSRVQESFDIGEASFQALASPVELDGGSIGTVIILRDITRLQELDRLKSKFVATVSHELRTPLANIKVYLSLLRRSKQDNRERYLGVLNQETDRLTSMIEELLDLSRLESQKEIEMEPVEITDILDQVVERHRPTCEEKGVHLAHKTESAVMVLGNRDQLIRLFTNLVANAATYTDSGGVISLNTTSEEEKDGIAYVCVEVRDNGVGISEEDQPFLFGRFYRGTMARKHKIPGSGLGLAIVREIVNLHGGLVGVESEVGVGSVFTVRLPLIIGERG
ncbi:MAG: GAF domain-containing sensor histidine kinase [Anaerolineales bacterium]|nr:MAG: GAF domain-containing sensor histidine kinase [Anaerolineales bacterium]